MNDIDRSVDTLIFAMRRRFRFVEVTAESRRACWIKNWLSMQKKQNCLRNLNAAIENVQGIKQSLSYRSKLFLG